MHYDFGQYLRKRYEGFLSPVYSQKEIYVQSSDADRAIMSAMSNMAGMWPPTPEVHMYITLKLTLHANKYLHEDLVVHVYYKSTIHIN